MKVLRINQHGTITCELSKEEHDRFSQWLDVCEKCVSFLGRYQKKEEALKNRMFTLTIPDYEEVSAICDAVRHDTGTDYYEGYFSVVRKPIKMGGYKA